jgi:hypothetical protein
MSGLALAENSLLPQAETAPTFAPNPRLPIDLTFKPLEHAIAPTATRD